MTLEIQPDIQQVCETAARKAISSLNAAISRQGSAVWVLAGGTAPMVAYQLIAGQHAQAVDWTKVIVLMGDERCVPADQPESNWFQATRALLAGVPIPAANLIRPGYEPSAEVMAVKYERAVNALPKTEAGFPHFDLLWLGMGEDGHTLSLFPNHPALQLADRLVVPVHDSPKPPPDRISLSFAALGGAAECLIIAPGARKAPIIAAVRAGKTHFPVVQAAQAIEAGGGKVTWLVDQAALDI